MKLNIVSIQLIIGILLFFMACDDNLSQTGISIRPDVDNVLASKGTLEVKASTKESGPVYAKTKFPTLGEYIDPVFGAIKSDYLGEFYYSDSEKFKEGAKIDSVLFTVSYSSYIGDSITPMNMSVFEIEKSLPKKQYTSDIDPTEYVDMNKEIGRQYFTGKNADFHAEYGGTASTPIVVYDVKVKLNKEIGERFLTEFNKPNNGAFNNIETFRDFFKGVYVTTTFGSGTIININLSSLRIHYNYLDKGGSSKKGDTIRTSSFLLNITPEVTQINHITKSNENFVEEPDKTFIKAPAGLNTQIEFPLTSIKDKLKDNALNQAEFEVFVDPEATMNKFVKIGAPRYLLLINRDSLDSFFEDNKLPDNVTSYLTSFNEQTYSYNFGNISAMINFYKQKKEGISDLTYLLIPVNAVFQEQSGGYGRQSSKIITDIYNEMRPSAAVIDVKKEKLKLDLIYSKPN